MSGLSLQTDALRRLAFFHELADSDLARVRRVGRRRAFDAGESLVERGLLGRTYAADAGATLNRARRSATVTAIEPVEALVIETMYFEPFLIENPSVAVAILRSVVARLWALEEQLETAG